ncbi:alanine dehydrogenase [Flexistipes sinusarabici DSM 4947]|uniref:Alanine dehydrogenase n=1 Tax=Flexistipes sinusarabici (strain ATCC 49648 / DSM 4947 / MAS 10) TaxID=717231 RepID=F8E6A3_FLESM|nr:alanine dehydrogenase [Flexistipes sinusarabici]AEI15870.1 alanine dehydrogenase [Flexistipes sinusarabici DSM 4947]
MKVGCVKEIKSHEYRVGLTPSCAEAYIRHGHNVFIENSAGINAGYTDEEYKAAGALLIDDKRKIFNECEMIVKVKEPLRQECELFHSGQILFTFLHLASNEVLTQELLRAGIKGVAYETIETENGQLPLLKPMSEISGRLSIQEGAKFLEKPFGGRGVLLGGVPGVEKGKVAVLGAGVVGTNAVKMAYGLGAKVTVLDININRLEYLDDIFDGRIETLYSSRANIEKILAESDLLIGAVLIHGAKAPHLIKRDDLKNMKNGAVVVDVAVDQGGCVETSKPTAHDNPVFVIDDVVHYCVANMPGAVARTATQALTGVTLKYGLEIADKGLEKAARENNEIAAGINLYESKLTYRAVADDLGLEYTDLRKII